jgi:menaquinone-specific isochorismate synthase
VTSTVVDAGKAPLLARSRAIPDPGPLLDLLPEADHVAWVRGGDGIVGWGRAAQFSDGDFAAAHRWWSSIVSSAIERRDIDAPGSGLVAFGSFPFVRGAAGGVLIVPEVVVGRHEGKAWVTTIGPSLSNIPDLLPSSPPRAVRADISDSFERRASWRQSVADAVAHIASGELDKVVLARSLTARFDAPLDVRRPLRRLEEGYRGCWTFHVDGFFGATPELLVRQGGGLVTSRVLAGTIRRTGEDSADLALAGSLARSGKDLVEHEYAVRSVADALSPHCSAINVPEAPYVLHLPNVMHLASDVTGVLRDGTSVLQLVGALHPSAAVGGTPTDRATELIAEIEGLDRDRYAGPVGWIGADGDGEWGIGLRSARLAADGLSAQLYAGCGIVADSEPESELAEADAKLVPVRDALS